MPLLLIGLGALIGYAFSQANGGQGASSSTAGWRYPGHWSSVGVGRLGWREPGHWGRDEMGRLGWRRPGEWGQDEMGRQELGRQGWLQPGAWGRDELGRQGWIQPGAWGRDELGAGHGAGVPHGAPHVGPAHAAPHAAPMGGGGGGGGWGGGGGHHHGGRRGFFGGGWWGPYWAYPVVLTTGNTVYRFKGDWDGVSGPSAIVAKLLQEGWDVLRLYMPGDALPSDWANPPEPNTWQVEARWVGGA